MTAVARITKHPADRECVLVHVPPDLNNDFGRFGPARLSPEHHAYVLHHSHVDALYRFARTITLHLVDDRVSSHRGPAVQPTECRSCGQAGARFNPPTVCPSCGDPWSPRTPPVRESPRTHTPCPRCGHKQPGRFPYCSRCGATMEHEPLTVMRLPLPEQPRVHLDDPLPLGTVIAAATTVLPGEPTTNITHISGRPVEDVPLPDVDPRQVDLQHQINAAQAAIRHRPVPSRDLAVQQAKENPWPEREPRQLPPQVVKDALIGRRPLPPRESENPSDYDDPEPPDPADGNDPWATPSAPAQSTSSDDPWGAWGPPTP